MYRAGENVRCNSPFVLGRQHPCPAPLKMLENACGPDTSTCVSLYPPHTIPAFHRRAALVGMHAPQAPARATALYPRVGVGHSEEGGSNSSEASVVGNTEGQSQRISNRNASGGAASLALRPVYGMVISSGDAAHKRACSDRACRDNWALLSLL